MECENYIGEHIFFPWSYLVLLSYAVCSLTVCFSWMNPSCSVWHWCNSNSYMQISKNKRHQDRAAALEVWDRLEEFMRSRSRGWGVPNFIKKTVSFFMLLAGKPGWTNAETCSGASFQYYWSCWQLLLLIFTFTLIMRVLINLFLAWPLLPSYDCILYAVNGVWNMY